MATLLALATQPLFGQQVVGPEIRSGVFQTYSPVAETPTPALGITRDHSGFAICWSALNAAGQERVFVARLTAEANAISTIELPVADPTGASDAYHPSIASDDNGFLVAWVELSRFTSQRLIFMAHLDRSGQLVGVPRVVWGPPSYLLIVVAPSVVWNGADYYVVGGLVLRTSADGASTDIFDLRVAVDAIVAAPELVTAGHTIQRIACCHGPLCPPCDAFNTPLDLYTVDIEVLGRCSLHKLFDGTFHSLGIGIASGREQYLVVWPLGQAQTGSTLRAIRVSKDCGLIDSWSRPLLIDVLPVPFSGGRAMSNPQVAWDGSRFLIVYQVNRREGGFEIRGATVTDGQVGTPFVIATGSVRRAAVIAAGEGHFLVGYETYRAEGTQLVGRFIDFPEPRRRVVR